MIILIMKLNKYTNRNKNGIFYSFEDITSGLGIEFNQDIRDDLNYSTLNLVLNHIDIGEEEIDFGTLIENNSISKFLIKKSVLMIKSTLNKNEPASDKTDSFIISEFTLKSEIE